MTSPATNTPHTQPQNAGCAAGATSFTGARVGIVGLGKSGLAAASVLASLGAHVHGFDADLQRIDTARAELGIEATAVAEPAALPAAVTATGVRLVVVSPGVPQHHPIYRATPAGVEVIGEVELAWRIQHAHTANPATPWLAITGTNGKTTTTAMTAAILQAGGMNALAVGNIGTPVVEAVATGGRDAFVVELSSFQLYSAHTISPEAAVCLNLDTDHLDWHTSLAAYRDAKARVYHNTRRACLYPVTDREVMAMVEEADVIEGARAIGLSFQAPAVSQIGIVEDLIVDRAFLPNRAREALELARLDDLPSRSMPIIADALAAAGLARAIGIDPGAVSVGLRDFQPQPHRRVTVGEFLDVTWIDDSKATNAHAAQASLTGYRPQSVVWIAGGDAKGQDFSELVRAVAPTLRGVVLIGVDQTALRTALASYAPHVPVMALHDHPEVMESAVHEAVALSRPGDHVILAPACASWDQFANYGERGDIFAAVVTGLEAQ